MLASMTLNVKVRSCLNLKLVELGTWLSHGTLGKQCISFSFVFETSYLLPRSSAFMLTNQVLESISSCEAVVTN